MKYKEIYYHRKAGKIVEAQVFEKELLEFLFTPAGKLFHFILKFPYFSMVYGFYLSSKLSRYKIKDFIKKYSINMNESLKSIEEFQNFNDFFTRKLKKSARRFSDISSDFCAPCDGRMLVFENIKDDFIFYYKNKKISLKRYYKDIKKFINGTFVIIRLTPLDYHRFYFFDSGLPSESLRIPGFYYTVNPLSLLNNLNIFCENVREHTLFLSDNFGEVLYTEIGAIGVGRIVQTFRPFRPVIRGEEKGYFEFGASTLTLLFKKDIIKIDKDILDYSQKGIETRVLCGEKIGERN